jgi:hypothetical protein
MDIIRYKVAAIWAAMGKDQTAQQVSREKIPHNAMCVVMCRKMLYSFFTKNISLFFLNHTKVLCSFFTFISPSYTLSHTYTHIQTFMKENAVEIGC